MTRSILADELPDAAARPALAARAAKRVVPAEGVQDSAAGGQGSLLGLVAWYLFTLLTAMAGCQVLLALGLTLTG